MWIDCELLLSGTFARISNFPFHQFIPIFLTYVTSKYVSVKIFISDKDVVVILIFLNISYFFHRRMKITFSISLLFLILVKFARQGEGKKYFHARNYPARMKLWWS